MKIPEIESSVSVDEVSQSLLDKEPVLEVYEEGTDNYAVKLDDKRLKDPMQIGLCAVCALGCEVMSNAPDTETAIHDLAKFWIDFQRDGFLTISNMLLSHAKGKDNNAILRAFTRAIIEQSGNVADMARCFGSFRTLVEG